MSQRRSPQLAAAVCVAVGLLVAVASSPHGAEARENLERVKRQSGAGQQPQDTKPLSASIGLNAQGGGQASSMSLSSALSSRPQVETSLDAGQMMPAPKRPRVPKRRPPLVGAGPEPADGVLDEELDEEAQTVRPPRRRPLRPRPQPQRRPSRYDEESGEEEEDCYDANDYDYGHHLFHEPMHQIKSMMGHVFSQMRGLQAEDMARGGNSALASSLNSGDGYSRTSSVVNSNGRTRGLVSETSNGRTKTRRIGGADDDEEEEE